MWWLLLLIPAFWLSCGALARGYALAFFQGHYPGLNDYQRDLRFATRWGFFSGPCGLLIMYFDKDFGKGKYGWRWK